MNRRRNGRRTKPQAPADRIDVRHLERLPLGLSYPTVVQRVKEILARPPLCGDERIEPAALVIDQTPDWQISRIRLSDKTSRLRAQRLLQFLNIGVGAAVGDIFVDGGLWPIRVSITGGSEVTGTGTWERQHWHVAKTVLISTVDAMLHTGTLRFAAALTEAGTMRDELLDFRRKLSDAGRATYAARTGRHDDLVLAVAIGCWWIARPPPRPAVFGSY
jgi:hypothetical protein